MSANELAKLGGFAMKALRGEEDLFLRLVHLQKNCSRLVQLSGEVVDGEEGVVELVSSFRCISRSFLCRDVLVRLDSRWAGSASFACNIIAV